MSEKRWYLRWDETGRYMGDIKRFPTDDGNYKGWTYEEFTPKACPKPELPDGLYLIRFSVDQIGYRMKNGQYLYKNNRGASINISENYVFLEYFGTGEELSPELKRHYGEK